MIEGRLDTRPSSALPTVRKARARPACAAVTSDIC
jgi:hypothetical protein